MKNRNKFTAILCAVLLLLSGCGKTESNDTSTDTTAEVSVTTETVMETAIIDSLDNGIVIDAISGSAYKTERNANPISGSIFCADPTAVEYEGRLYVYGTNDHQQSELDTTNDYDQINSLVVFSTDDMANWIYHGRIEVGEIAPWVNTSWAPSIVSRVEDDGLTHFYLYFSHNGSGVGVLTSTDPVTGWSDPLGKPLVYQNMPGLENCPAPFDPGVCIDENGTGWLSFGGGVHADGGKIHSFVPKIVKLGKDMLSFDSEFVSIDAPYFFEASELNYIDGTYYYTYCNDWQTRGAEWDYEGIEKPPSCSMAYLTTKTPLDSESWEYNRMTNAAITSRRACVEKIEILPDGTIPQVEMTSLGFEDVLNPYRITSADIACVLKGGCFITEFDCFTRVITGIKPERVIGYKYFDFGEDYSSKTMEFAAKVNGSGCNAAIRIIIDGEDGEEIGKCVIGAASGTYTAVVKI